MQSEHPEYRSLQERLALWRGEILTRMDRSNELVELPAFPRTNLARESGTTVRVGSFLGTANTDVVDDVYFDVSDAATGKVTTGALRFGVEDVNHPVLRELLDRFPIARVAGTGSDLDRAIRLRDWIKSLSPHRIPYRMPEWNALLILDRASRGVEHFICVHYSVALVQCALALGMQARMINLHRGISARYRVGDEAGADPPVDEHVVAEIWCAELERWVMMDTDFDCHYERAGQALSAWEIHQSFVTGELDLVACKRGPHSMTFDAYGNRLSDDGTFFATVLPSYYGHVSVLMRNDFLSDPDGPVTMAVLLDEVTAPILWHRGSDNRLQPHLMGPVVVAQPWAEVTPLLTDGNLGTGWASADRDGEHSVELALAGPRFVARVVLHWPEYRMRYHSSTAYVVEGRDGDGDWDSLIDVKQGRETPFCVHDFAARPLSSIRVRQKDGGGSMEYPNRLWLNQIEVYAP